MKHREKHPEPQPDCFGCKLQSINWGIVPGAYRDSNSTSYVDHESLRHDGVPTLEEVNDQRTDLYRAAGEAGVQEFDIGTNRGLAEWAEGKGH